jgi:hypothetical protein
MRVEYLDAPYQAPQPLTLNPFLADSVEKVWSCDARHSLIQSL